MTPRRLVSLSPEWLLTAVAFARGAVRPVFKVNELDNSDRPIHYATLENGQHKREVSSQLNVLSWNILRGYHVEKIKASLKRLIEENALDIVFIQEAPVYEAAKFSDDKLFHAFNKFYAPVHRVKQPRGKFNFKHVGNLVLSRYPFLKTMVHELPTTSDSCEQFFGDEQVLKRLAVYGQVAVGGKKVGLYNMHLENACLPQARLRQAKALLDELDLDDDITIAGGDMNTFFPQRFEPLFNYITQSGFAWPSRDIKGIRPRLSHFFVKGATVIGQKVTGSGSDHRPIMIRVQLTQINN